MLWDNRSNIPNNIVIPSDTAGANPGFLEQGFICVKVWGDSLC